MKQYVFPIALLGALVVVGGAYVLHTAPASPTAQETSPIPTPAETSVSASASAAPRASGYTLTDVAKHASAASCWTTINGKVYDLTSWINQHPGGPEAIQSLCGIDGSDAFNAQHGGQRRPASELAQFLIGDLH